MITIIDRRLPPSLPLSLWPPAATAAAAAVTGLALVPARISSASAQGFQRPATAAAIASAAAAVTGLALIPVRISSASARAYLKATTASASNQPMRFTGKKLTWDVLRHTGTHKI